MTQAVIRGLDNAMPLSTQHWYNKTNKGATGVWTDAYIEEFKKVIDAEISDIMDEWDTGKYNTLVIGDGDAFFNSAISNISITRAPKLYNYLKSKVQQLYKYVDEHPHTKESTGSINQHGADQYRLKLNALSISNKTEEFGVHIDNNIIKNYKNWLNLNEDGIVAYRIHKTRFNTK